MSQAMQEISVGTVPEPGQLVEVRRRQWVVGDVARSAIGGRSEFSFQHLVRLSSIDEDALGEDIEVIWEIEPGARVLDRAGLPSISGMDDPDWLDAFLDAVRWGAATNADRSFLQSPFRSGVSIEDFQLDPLVRAIDMARVNLLIADDVGLGKTIEAGLVIQELLIRHRARTVLIVCPASLQVKWRTEMLEKFGLEFRIVDTEHVRHLRRERGIHANPWTSFPRLIASMDWMKGGEPLRMVKDALPPHITYPRKFDILVVDEAHNVAPAAATKYALESQRTRLIRLIAPHFEHRLFLSATPHNGYQESFTSLLELLDNQRFARTIMPDPKQLQRVMVRRLKSDIVDADGKPIFPVRKLVPLAIDYTKEEREIHDLLQRYADSRIAAARGTRFEYGTEFVLKLLKKRLFSSPAAFATTLAKHRESVSHPAARISGGKMDDRLLKRAILRTEEDYANDGLIEEAHAEALEAAAIIASPLSDEQRNLLDRMGKWAETARHQEDSKAKAILAWLDDHLKTGGKWNGRRVLMFTEYRPTLQWLQQVFTSHGFGGDRLMILHGDTDKDEREEIKAAFQANPDVSPVRILLATDAASEGIDLQNHCNLLIHVEIPWNPNVMEQRNGRIDRHGQKRSEVLIWHPVDSSYKDTDLDGDVAVGRLAGDLEFLMRAVRKLETIRGDLGSVGPVIARQIEEAMLGNRRRIDTQVADGRISQARKMVAAERQLSERIARLHEKLVETRDGFHLSPGRISQAVRVGLELAGHPVPKPVTPKGTSPGVCFEMPMLPGSWARCAEGLHHPHTKERRPITFDHRVASGRDDIVLVHMNHRLVQMCLRLLRSEVWAQDDVKRLHRVSVKVLPDKRLEGPAVVVWSRLVITGGNHHRLHEELTVSGGFLSDRSFVRIPQVTLLESLIEESRSAARIPPSLFDALANRFRKHEEAIRGTVESRSRDRLRYLGNTLERRKKAEIDDIGQVLDELDKAIRREMNPELARIGPVQLELDLWPDDQRDQLRKDMESLRVRLERIPEERTLELAAIESRYGNLTDRTFPVAVVFLVPQSLASKE